MRWWVQTTTAGNGMPVLNYSRKPVKGWTEVDQAGFDAANATHAAAFDAWRIDNPVDTKRRPMTFTAQDGSLWQINSQGRLVQV